MHKFTKGFLIGTMIVSLIALIPSGAAWKHGKYSYEYALSPQDYTPSYYYSTIDWIADGAMELLLHSGDQWQWLYTYRSYFFTGTEMLASEQTQCEANGTIITGQSIESKLYFRWNITKHIFSENFMNGFTSEWNRTLVALEQRNYAEAAVRFGILVAYVANAVAFPNYEVGDQTFWRHKTLLDDLLNQYTSSYADSQWFFVWYPHTPDPTLESSSIKDLADSIMWHPNFNGFWMNDTLPQVEIVSDYFAMQKLGNTSLTYQFFTRMERILNDAIQFSADMLATLVSLSGAEGGDIDAPSWYSFMSTKTWAYFGGGTAGVIGIIFAFKKWKDKRSKLISIKN